LTEGRLNIVGRVDLRPGAIPDDTVIDNLACALGKPSRHPLSRAFVDAMAGGPDSPAVSDWKESRGRGVQATMSARTVRLGALDWLKESGVETGGVGDFVSKWTAKGATLVGLSEGGKLIGVFALIDALKAGALQVVQALQARRREVWLISGDREAVALEIGQRAGIPAERIFSEVKPEQKAGIIEKLQSEGRSVAFVGDGINDAPALKQADLGIAVSRASDVAREAADIILLNSDVQAIPMALGLANATLRTIKQNLFWAFFYNAAAIPLAALGFLNPMLCAAAMGMSDIVVVGNALRLKGWSGWD